MQLFVFLLSCGARSGGISRHYLAAEFVALCLYLADHGWNMQLEHNGLMTSVITKIVVVVTCCCFRWFLLLSGPAQRPGSRERRG